MDARFFDATAPTKKATDHVYPARHDARRPSDRRRHVRWPAWLVAHVRCEQARSVHHPAVSRAAQHDVRARLRRLSARHPDLSADERAARHLEDRGTNERRGRLRRRVSFGSVACPRVRARRRVVARQRRGERARDVRLERHRPRDDRRASTLKHRELPRVLRRAVGLVRFARGTVGASSASIFIVESGTDTLHGVVSEWDWTRTSFVSSLERWPTALRALESGDLHTISRAQASGAEAEWFEPRGVIRTVCVPLRAEDRRLGVLFFDFDTEGGEREADLTFLADVGNRCARAIARRPRGATKRDSSASFEARPRASRLHEPQR
ncbi:MAG: GAF domain-containing protein [Labilithrix sp.]|nr:GAF domain-containing protein [Labilithrix sp.]